jgi:hypothetical protein
MRDAYKEAATKAAHTREELLKQIHDKAVKFNKVFTDNVYGHEVQQAIKDQFGYGELTDSIDPTAIIIKAAQRDVIDYIERMVRQGKRTAEDASQDG